MLPPPFFEVNSVKKNALAIVLIITMILNVSGCNRQEQTRYQAEFLDVFDTVTQIVGYTNTKEEFSEYTQNIYDNLKEYHQLYDIYNDYEGVNNLKTINDQAGISPVKVDSRIIDLLLFSREAYELSQGKINVAYGTVLKVWHEYRTKGIDDPEKASIPSLELLKEKSKHTNINDLIIDQEASTVYLKDPEMSLDVGAIGKGYATEMVSLLAIEDGLSNGMISVGGNVRTFGGKGSKKEPWKVGVQNPAEEKDKPYLELLHLNDKSLVTSGDYQRYYTVDGKRYHHIIDPNTLMPSDYFTAVTIVCMNSGMADALSTAIYNMNYEDGLKFIEGLEDVEALWLFKDGTIKYSAHFSDFLKK